MGEPTPRWTVAAGSQTSERLGRLVCPRPMHTRLVHGRRTMRPRLSFRCGQSVGLSTCVSDRIGSSLMPCRASSFTPSAFFLTFAFLNLAPDSSRILCPSYLCHRGTYVPFHCIWGLRVISSPPLPKSTPFSLAWLHESLRPSYQHTSPGIGLPFCPGLLARACFVAVEPPALIFGRHSPPYLDCLSLRR